MHRGGRPAGAADRARHRRVLTPAPANALGRAYPHAADAGVVDRGAAHRQHGLAGPCRDRSPHEAAPPGGDYRRRRARPAARARCGHAAAVDPVVRRRRRHRRGARAVLRHHLLRLADRLRADPEHHRLSVDRRHRADGGAAAEHGRRHRQLRAARAAVLHPRRPRHGARRHLAAPRPVRACAGRAFSRRAAARHGDEHVSRLRIVRLEDRRRRRRRLGDARHAAQGGLRPGRGRRRARGLGGDGRDRAAEHRHAGAGFGDDAVDGRAVRRRASFPPRWSRSA